MEESEAMDVDSNNNTKESNVNVVLLTRGSEIAQHLRNKNKISLDLKELEREEIKKSIDVEKLKYAAKNNGYLTPEQMEEAKKLTDIYQLNKEDRVPKIKSTGLIKCDTDEMKKICDYDSKTSLFPLNTELLKTISQPKISSVIFSLYASPLFPVPVNTSPMRLILSNDLHPVVSSSFDIMMYYRIVMKYIELSTPPFIKELNDEESHIKDITPSIRKTFLSDLLKIRDSKTIRGLIEEYCTGDFEENQELKDHRKKLIKLYEKGSYLEFFHSIEEIDPKFKVNTNRKTDFSEEILSEYESMKSAIYEKLVFLLGEKDVYSLNAEEVIKEVTEKTEDILNLYEITIYRLAPKMFPQNHRLMTNHEEVNAWDIHPKVLLSLKKQRERMREWRIKVYAVTEKVEVERINAPLKIDPQYPNPTELVEYIMFLKKQKESPIEEALKNLTV